MWYKSQIHKNSIITDTGKSVLIALPHKSEYDGFAFWHPSKLVREGEYRNTVSISYNEDFVFKLKKYGKGKYNCREIIIVDGFHRYRTMLEHKDIYERENGCLPVVVIDKDISNRMASTIRHDRARGSHSIDLMVNIVAELTESGMSDAWIMKNIGMDAEELLRLKQISGLAALFKDKDFSNSWEVDK